MRSERTAEDKPPPYGLGMTLGAKEEERVRENRPSGTAYLIAGSLLAARRDPVLSGLLPPRGADLGEWVIADTLRNGRLLVWALRQGWGRGLVRVIERRVLPGIQAHYIVRKRFIEDIVRAALLVGDRQVVNIGAGFDSLCWRLHPEHPHVNFLEIDHPGTQRAKQDVLERHGAIRPNLYLDSADLTASRLEVVLGACPQFDALAPTVFVLEALLMYLTEPEVTALFHAIHRLNLPKTIVIFTFMEPQSDGRVNFPQASPFVTWWLQHHAEPFKWGIPRADLPQFLADLGFSQTDLANERVLRERYLPSDMKNPPLAVGELVCVAALKNSN